MGRIENVGPNTMYLTRSILSHMFMFVLLLLLLLLL